MCGGAGDISGRNFGFDLCSACEAGHLTGRLGAWNADVAVEEVLYKDARGEEYLQIRVDARVEGAAPVFAKFRKKSLGTALLGAFRKQLKSGDAMFDSAVSVESTTPEPLKQLLENDGFQSAVMTLTTHAGSFEIKPGNIKLRARIDDLDLRAEVPLATCAILRHIAHLR